MGRLPALMTALWPLLACSADVPADPAWDVHAEAIVYGDDNRTDAHEVGAPFDELATRTAVALIAPQLLRKLDEAHYAIDAPRYEDVQSLCDGERFADQPVAGSCSGVLLPNRIVATAGHCLGVAPDGSIDCSQSRYVFGYMVRQPNAPVVVAARDVFQCERVLGRIKTAVESSCRFDVVLVELAGKDPAEGASIRESPVVLGESLVVIGTPAGLPIKVDRGARVIETRSEQGDYFTLDSDTFAASSGSGVFDVEGKLVGLFARGRRDYDYTDGCNRVHREAADSSIGYEHATHIAAVQQLTEATGDNARAEPRDLEAACDPADYLEIVPSATDETESGGCTAAGARGRRGWNCMAAWWTVALVLSAARRRVRAG